MRYWSITNWNKAREQVLVQAVDTFGPKQAVEDTAALNFISFHDSVTHCWNSCFCKQKWEMHES